MTGTVVTGRGPSARGGRRSGWARPNDVEARWLDRLPGGPPSTALVRVSAAADGSRLWYAVLAGLALRPAWRSAAGAGALAAVAAAGTTQALARLTDRPRPPADHPARQAMVRRPDAPSFPSSHTAVAAAVVTAVGRRAPAVGAALLPLALTLAYGRVRLRAHWPTDVAAGALLGVAVGAMVRR